MCSYWSSRRGVCSGISPNGGTSANTFVLHLDENYWVLSYEKHVALEKFSH
jgi:hypothetical protein